MALARLPWRWERQAALGAHDDSYHEPMQPFFMGAAARRLFAIFHPAAAGGSPARAAVLICGPHGQEAIRAHRLQRVLAERLARCGCDVLRFDPYGCGDSAGADEELDWPGWISDVAQAAAELARRSPGRPQIWVGFRLGATAACAALQRDAAAALPPADRASGPRTVALVLCEPVLDGAEYLRSLALATVRALEASCSIKQAAWRRTLRDDPAVFEREAVGFALGDGLYAALRDLSPAAVDRPDVASIAVLSPGEDRALGDAVARWRSAGCGVCLDAVPYSFDWTAEEALNTAIVPHELVQRMAELVESATAGCAR
jgi:alpha/beta superfamily hydrolase